MAILRSPVPILAALVALAACEAVPGPPAPAMALASPPVLISVTGLLAAGDALAEAPPAAAGLDARADALTARADGLGVGTPPADSARAADLAARAQALRAPVLDEAERARLAAGDGTAASLP